MQVIGAAGKFLNTRLPLLATAAPAAIIALPAATATGQDPGRTDEHTLFEREDAGIWLQSRDYFAILSPPGPGTHVVETLGVVRPPGEPRFELGMTYRLTVAAAS